MNKAEYITTVQEVWKRVVSLSLGIFVNYEVDQISSELDSLRGKHRELSEIRISLNGEYSIKELEEIMKAHRLLHKIQHRMTEFEEVLSKRKTQ